MQQNHHYVDLMRAWPAYAGCCDAEASEIATFSLTRSNAASSIY
jgi:hypothetical protein